MGGGMPQTAPMPNMMPQIAVNNPLGQPLGAPAPLHVQQQQPHVPASNPPPVPEAEPDVDFLI